jgi:hypothetical protein
MPAAPLGPAAAIERAPAERRSANRPNGAFAAADERPRTTSGE